MTKSPGSYGIKAGTTPCYNSSTGGVCKNPSQFLYFDTLHPVTTIHKWSDALPSPLLAYAYAGTDCADSWRRR